ncbi:hypothetical protein D3C75_1015940 [compost metagenome]
MVGLEHEADVPAAQGGAAHLVEAGGGLAIQPVLAGIRRIEQTEHVEQGRLARAGRPHHRQILAGSDLEIHRIQAHHPLFTEVKAASHLAQANHGGDSTGVTATPSPKPSCSRLGRMRSPSVSPARTSVQRQLASPASTVCARSTPASAS